MGKPGLAARESRPQHRAQQKVYLWIITKVKQLRHGLEYTRPRVEVGNYGQGQGMGQTQLR